MPASKASSQCCIKRAAAMASIQSCRSQRRRGYTTMLAKGVRARRRGMWHGAVRAAAARHGGARQLVELQLAAAKVPVLSLSRTSIERAYRY
jgi:hypothetical protein